MYLGLPLSLCFALAACSDKDADQKNAAAPSATQKQKITTSVDRLMQWPEKDLRAKASKAVIEQRWYKPSGDSALEYYLALKRKLNAPDESVDTALTDILPYAVIGMDQAIANFDDKEALRLEGLIRMADPNAPALARVKSDLEKMKTRQAQAETDKASADVLAAENEAKAKEDAAKAKEDAKKAKEESAKAEQTVAAPVVQAPAPVVQAPPPPVQQAPAPVVQAPAAKAAIVPLQTPQPEYPREALVAGTKGEVVAEISINGAGAVTGVRIISASPRGVFDKSVVSTVRRWKYQGNGENTTVRRTFVFN
ncbi:MAG TPA: energy transducer TonB [Arenimonas sp.]|nr:energy transducer TonB [Arenimonas sp.]